MRLLAGPWRCLVFHRREKRRIGQETEVTGGLPPLRSFGRARSVLQSKWHQRTQGCRRGDGVRGDAHDRQLPKCLRGLSIHRRSQCREQHFKLKKHPSKATGVNQQREGGAKCALIYREDPAVAVHNYIARTARPA